MRAIQGAFARPLVRLVVAGFAVQAWLNSAQAQLTTTTFNIKEIGTDLNPTIQLEIPLPTQNIITSFTSPSGEVLNASQIKTFPSLDAAFYFLAGSWRGTYVPRFPFGSAEQEFEFEVVLVSPNSVYRGLPLNVSLRDGDRIKSGQTFLMSWDYESDEPIHGTSLQVVAHINSHAFSSLTILSTPRPGFPLSAGGTSAVGTGASSARFARWYESEPGASENRFLVTYTASGSGSPLPADVALTIGASTNLNSAITNPEDADGNPFNGPPTVGLRYYRTANPIEFQLVGIPEPTSWALAAIAIGAVRRPRRRSTHTPGGIA